MEKEAIVAWATSLTIATEQAQQWVGRNEERVRSCGKSKDEVLTRLRKQSRLLRRLGRAAARKMCVGVFGPSQAGKSYLLSSLARDENKEVRCDFGDQQYDFLKDLNPGGSKESTGLVTRFTMTSPEDIPAGYPVHVRLLSETDLVKIFANTYFCDCDHKEKVDKEAIKTALLALKARMNQTVCAHVTLDAMEELREYVTGSFAGMARAAALEEEYWDTAIEIAPRLSLEDRAKLFSLVWDGIPEFNGMFLALATDLSKLGNADEAFCAMDSLIPREASIIDVDTLGKTNFSQWHVGSEIQMRTREGKTASITRRNASAIIAELTLVMTHKPADYFDHTDLLDFPGYKARLECTDIRDYLHKGKEDSAVEQFFRRGKVAYLFQRYNTERELTSLLLCVATSDNTPGLPGAVEDWIIATHGRTPADRAKSRTALFYILTKSDHHFEEKSGARFETRWDDVLRGMFLGHFSGAYSQNTRWVEEWTPNQPFNNLFMLRNINIKWDNMMSCTSDSDWQETGVRPDKEKYRDDLRAAFLNSPLVIKHFSNPQIAFDEVMKINDGGIENIKRCLQPLCDPNLKLSQILNGLYIAQEDIVAILTPFYHSGTQEEELKKKMALFTNFSRLIGNAGFRERFPELLSNFKIAPDPLVELFRNAERRFDDYRETLFAKQQAAFESQSNSTMTNEAQEQNDTAPLDLLNMLDDSDSEPQNVATKISPVADSPKDKDEFSFYAESILEAWDSRMRSVAETEKCARWYMFPKTLLLPMLDEFDLAVTRMHIQDKLERKFREIAQPVDLPKRSKIQKQASYASSVLNDFISWLGKNPAATNESDRVINYCGKQVTVFKNIPPITGYPVLPETTNTFKKNTQQWCVNWSVTFYGLLVENAMCADGTKINLEENAALGKILDKMRQKQGVTL